MQFVHVPTQCALLRLLLLVTARIAHHPCPDLRHQLSIPHNVRSVTIRHGLPLSRCSVPKIGKGDPPNIGKGNPPKIGKGDPPNIGKGNPPKIAKGNPPNIGKRSPPNTHNRSPPKIGKVSPPNIGKRNPPNIGKGNRQEQIYLNSREAEQEQNQEPDLQSGSEEAEQPYLNSREAEQNQEPDLQSGEQRAEQVQRQQKNQAPCPPIT